MAAGYSGKPLAQKLGIKGGARLVVVNPPESYWKLLGPLPDGVSTDDQKGGPAEVVHLFVRDRAALVAELPALRARIAPAGMIWVSWPKRSSGVATDLSENSVRDVALEAGLVDVKVCAVDETWSGLKLVIRLKDRR